MRRYPDVRGWKGTLTPYREAMSDLRITMKDPAERHEPLSMNITYREANQNRMQEFRYGLEGPADFSRYDLVVEFDSCGHRVWEHDTWSGRRRPYT